MRVAAMIDLILWGGAAFLVGLLIYGELMLWRWP